MSEAKPPAPDPSDVQWRLWLAVLLGMLLLLFATGWFGGLDGVETRDVPYSEFKALVSDGEIGAVEFDGVRIEAFRRDDDESRRNMIRSVAPAGGDPALLPLLEQSGATVLYRASSETMWLVGLLPWLLIMAFFYWSVRRAAGQIGGLPGGAGDFLRAKTWTQKKTVEEVTFDDVAGQDQAKREVAELIDFLRNPELFARLGARPPKGVLLMGPPGTGKTLLARALAGEAGVPFFSTSGSAFIELFVGMGASRVRRLFEDAAKNAPSIIFIDELDSIGRVRGAGLGGGHDEREQTLNQILAELDGFVGREAVVVLAATNRPDVLDPALLRPGRFDRHVTLTLPDRTARRAILAVHSRDVPLADDADLDAVARGTPGFSGADLRNLINEAAIRAAQQGAQAVAKAHLDEARDRVMMGTIQTLAIQPEERHRIAVHEAGHAAAAFYLPGADPLFKVTIIPRGRTLGGTQMLPEEERHTLPEAYLRDQLAIRLAGRASERHFLGSVSSGADDDIQQATRLARSMAARWGMSEQIGPVDLRQSEEHPFLGREIAQPRHFADQTAAKVDEAVAEMLVDAERRATEIIEAHEGQIRGLIDRLEKDETLDRGGIETCLSPNPGLGTLHALPDQ